MIRRSVCLGSMALVALLLAAKPAAAEELFTAPESTRVTAPCFSDNPCRLDSALTIAGLGDTVLMKPGEFFQSGSMPWPTLPDLKAGVVVKGLDPAEPPVIHGLVTANATPFIKLKPSSTLQDVEIEMSPAPSLLISYAVVLEAGSLMNRARVEATNPGGVSLTACLVGGGTIRNSVCTGTGPGSVTALQNTFTGANFTTGVINTTAISNGATGFGMRVAISSPHTSVLNISNSIARGPTADLATGTFVGSPPQGTAVINVQYSNWNTYTATGMGTNQILPGAGNQTGGTAAAPVFVDAAIGDYRQDSTSPTIDSGQSAAAPDSFTLGHTTRVFGPAPDIGAYEFVPSPSVTTLAATEVTTGQAVLRGTIDPNGSFTRARFDFGETTAYGQSVDLASLSYDDPETPFSTTVEGLAPDTTYHYRLTGTSNGGGTGTGATMTFTTPPTGLPDEKLVLSGLRIKKKWSLRKGTFVRFRLSREATVRLVFDRQKGKKRFVRRGVKVVNGKSGLNKIRIKPKLKGGKKLRPGRYRLRAIAIADGNGAPVRQARFRILR